MLKSSSLILWFSRVHIVLSIWIDWVEELEDEVREGVDEEVGGASITILRAAPSWITFCILNELFSSLEDCLFLKMYILHFEYFWNRLIDRLYYLIDYNTTGWREKLHLEDCIFLKMYILHFEYFWNRLIDRLYYLIDDNTTGWREELHLLNIFEWWINIHLF